MYQPFLICIALAGSALLAQTTPPGSIQSTGTATVNVKPDQVDLDVSVITQGTTAQQAAQQNATQTQTMIDALKKTLGTSGQIETVSYSVYPRYSNVSGQTSTVIGYTASNTVRVTSYDLTLAGPLIDTANQAGANGIGGLSFGLRDPEPAKQQALTAAAKQAQAHAAAIAAGLPAKVGAVISAQEGATVTPYPVYSSAAGVSSTSTPVVTGTVAVTATVTITVQLLP